MDREITLDRAEELRSRVSEAASKRKTAEMDDNHTEATLYKYSEETLEDLCQRLESSGVREQALMDQLDSLKEKIESAEDGTEEMAKFQGVRDAIVLTLETYYGYGPVHLGTVESVATVEDHSLELTGSHGQAQFRFASETPARQLSQILISTLEQSEEPTGADTDASPAMSD